MQVRARVDKKAATDPNVIAVATRLGVLPADLFDLTVRDGGTGVTETFLNLTTKESARRADRVLAAESNLVRVTQSLLQHITRCPWRDTGGCRCLDGRHQVYARENTAPADVAVDSAVLDATTYNGSLANKTGLYQLEKVDLFNLLCILSDARGGRARCRLSGSAQLLCETTRHLVGRS